MKQPLTPRAEKNTEVTKQPKRNTIGPIVIGTLLTVLAASLYNKDTLARLFGNTETQSTSFTPGMQPWKEETIKVEHNGKPVVITVTEKTSEEILHSHSGEEIIASFQNTIIRVDFSAAEQSNCVVCKFRKNGSGRFTLYETIHTEGLYGNNRLVWESDSVNEEGALEIMPIKCPESITDDELAQYASIAWQLEQTLNSRSSSKEVVADSVLESLNNPSATVVKAPMYGEVDLLQQ